MKDDVSVKACRYINENFRPRHHSNREFCLSCGIDEKTGRLIQQENYNPSIKLLKEICDYHNAKLSTLFLGIGE